MTRDWTASGVFVLRHAGLPFDLLEEFAAAAGLLSAADALLNAEEVLIATAVQAGVSAARVWSAVTAADPGLLPAHADPGWEHAASCWRDRLRVFGESFEAEEERAWSSLRLVLNRADVQEAIFLSNPEVYRNMLVPFLAGPHPRNARWRRASRQLYTYVQRLCAKNETVSFFGPMAYGTVRAGYGAGLRTDVPRRRRVYFAYWAAREVADAVARDRRLRAVLPFRFTGAHPGGGHGEPGGDRPELASVLAAVLRAGPEGASLARVAAAVPGAPRDTASRLLSLVADGRLEFGIVPEPYDTDPLGAMLRRLAGIVGPAAREWSEKLGKLRGLLAELETTAFPGRIACVERLEQEFSAVTGKPARRGAGAVYADRAVFYEECASPFALEVGEQTLRSWIKQVSASLEVSAAHGAASQQAAVEEVRAALGAVPPLRFDDYAARLVTTLEPGGSQFVPAHLPSYPAAESKRVTEDLLDAAAGLPGDRYALIDLCLAAADTGRLPAAAVILSRCHHHLLTSGWLGEMYTGTEPFGADAAVWTAGHPELISVDAGRRNKGYYQFPGRRVVLRAPSAADADDPLVIWPAQITVEQTAAGPRCLDQAGRSASLYLPLSDLVNYPPYAALSHPQVLHAKFTAPSDAAGTGDTPEVIVGEAVYQRSRWRVNATELRGGTPRARFLQLRRLARRRIPGRFVFCRTDAERKPYLIDLASVLAADLAAHVAKGGGPLTVEQMRPAPDELWLRDEQGRRYTCELRIQVTGRERVRPSGQEETA